jgi:hypothetical protein
MNTEYVATCYDCQFCAYKPHEYGTTGRCVKDHFDGLPLEPMNARYAEWEEPLGGFPSYAESCPDFVVGERQMLCKKIAEKTREISSAMEEVDLMIEGIQDFDYQFPNYFWDTVPELYWADGSFDSSKITYTENPNRVWKTLGRGNPLF